MEVANVCIPVSVILADERTNHRLKYPVGSFHWVCLWVIKWGERMVNSKGFSHFLYRIIVEFRSIIGVEDLGSSLASDDEVNE